MVRIRFRRVGAKGQASFRLVAADRESPRDGRFIENLGFYNPRTEPATIQLKEDRIFDWLDHGAQPSESAEKVLRTAGTMDRYARFKAGEDIAILLDEAKAAEAARNIDPKTTGFATGKEDKEKAPATPVDESPVKAAPEEETPVAEEITEEDTLVVEETTQDETLVVEEIIAKETLVVEETTEEEAPVAEETQAEEATEESESAESAQNEE